MAIGTAGSLWSLWRRQETNSYQALTLDLANVTLPNRRRPDWVRASCWTNSHFVNTKATSETRTAYYTDQVIGPIGVHFHWFSTSTVLSHRKVSEQSLLLFPVQVAPSNPNTPQKSTGFFSKALEYMFGWWTTATLARHFSVLYTTVTSVKLSVWGYGYTVLQSKRVDFGNDLQKPS